MNVLETKSIKFEYSNGAKFAFPDIVVPDNSTFLITGKSGVGKTTLLHLLAGINLPTSGEIFVGNNNLSSLSARDLDAFRGKNIGLVLQQNYFINALTVEENLWMVSYLSNHKLSKAKSSKLLDHLELSHLKHKKTYEISVGQQQRLSIARALMNDPILLLADEPTSSLDDDNTQNVMTLLDQLSAEYKTGLVIVTHDFRLKQLVKQGINLI